MSFGGPSWPISINDLNLGTIGGGQCLGAIFDVTQGTDISSQGTPAWIVGDTFLVRFFSSASFGPSGATDVSIYLSLFSKQNRRKMCTVSSVPVIRRQLALRNSHKQPVVLQVRKAPLGPYLCRGGPSILTRPAYRTVHPYVFRMRLTFLVTMTAISCNGMVTHSYSV